MTVTQQRPITATASISDSWYASYGKRLIDIAVSAPLILLVSPVLLLAALILRLSLGPGVVLRQERVGRDGTTFAMYKLRTMHNSRRTAGESGWDGVERREHHKAPHDPRHTAIGRLCRKFSIDEVPQLFNVLKGDMSLVGPRPQLAHVASPAFRAHERHTVRPGLTGPFQLSPLRSGGDLDVGLELDADYVSNLSCRRDLLILLGTPFAVMGGSGS